MSGGPADRAVLSAANISMRYRRGGKLSGSEQIQALDGMSLEVRSGEILALVGPSGSGKSTLARCLAFLERPDSGEVGFQGEAVPWEDVLAMRGLRRRVQLVFQDPARAVSPRFTTEQVLREPQQAWQQRASPQRALDWAQLLAEVELDPKVLPMRARSLSGGQLQRLVLARALVTEPDALLLDETFSGLDLSLQAKLANLVLGLVESRGLTCVLITHNSALAEQLADRSLVLSQGRVVDERSAPDASTGGTS